MSMMSVLYMTKVRLNLLVFKRIMKHGEGVVSTTVPLTNCQSDCFCKTRTHTQQPLTLNDSRLSGTLFSSQQGIQLQ